MFNLIPTEPDEYKVYADWLEDCGHLCTMSIRGGVLPLDDEMGNGSGRGERRLFFDVSRYILLDEDIDLIENYWYGTWDTDFGIEEDGQITWGGGEGLEYLSIGFGLTWDVPLSGEGCPYLYNDF